MQHTPPRSPVTVSVTSTPAIGEITVTDNGPGMTAEQAARVFERFYRTDDARTRARGGTGLGLSIAASLAAAHGGDITVDTQPGRGRPSVSACRWPPVWKAGPERSRRGRLMTAYAAGCADRRTRKLPGRRAQRPVRTACGAHQEGGVGRSGSQACEHTSFACAEIGQQRFHRVINVPVRNVVTWLRRVPAFVSDPVQLRLTLLQPLERSVFVQGNYDRLNPACPEDHLMVGDLGLEDGKLSLIQMRLAFGNPSRYPGCERPLRPGLMSSRLVLLVAVDDGDLLLRAGLMPDRGSGGPFRRL